MSIDSINSNYYYQTQNSVKSDFRTFGSDATALQSALSSGNQDQVTLSENALSTALTQLMSDLPGGNSTQAQSSSTGSSQTQNPRQTLQSDLQTLQTALTSASGSSSTSSSDSSSSLSTALNNVLNDLSTMQSQGHHHHHHSSDEDSSDNSSSGSGASQNLMQTLQTDLQTLQSALTFSEQQFEFSFSRLAVAPGSRCEQSLE